MKEDIDEKLVQVEGDFLVKNAPQDLSILDDEQLMAMANSKVGNSKEKEIKKARKRTMKEITQQLLSLSAPDKVAKMIHKMTPELSEEEITASVALLQMQVYKGFKGDSKAFEMIRDMAGEKPSDKIEVQSNQPLIQVTADQIQAVIQNINQLAG